MGFVELLTFLNYSHWLMSWWLFSLIFWYTERSLADWQQMTFSSYTLRTKSSQRVVYFRFILRIFSLFGLTVVVSYGFYRWRLLILLQKWNKIVSEVTEKKITSEFDINTLSTSGKCASRKCAGTWNYGHPFADAS